MGKIFKNKDSVSNIDRIDEIRKHIGFCKGIVVMLEQLCYLSPDGKPGLAEVVEMESGGLLWLFMEASERLKHVDLLVNELEGSQDNLMKVA